MGIFKKDKGKDFIPRNREVEFKVMGRKFTYRIKDAMDESRWTNQILYYDEQEEDWKENIDKKLVFKLDNLVKVPWTKEDIKEALGKKKEWKDLTPQEREELIVKIKEPLRNALMKKINDLDAQYHEVKKN